MSWILGHKSPYLKDVLWRFFNYVHSSQYVKIYDFSNICKRLCTLPRGEADNFIQPSYSAPEQLWTLIINWHQTLFLQILSETNTCRSNVLKTCNVLLIFALDLINYFVLALSSIHVLHKFYIQVIDLPKNASTK